MCGVVVLCACVGFLVCNSYQPRFEKIRGSWTSIRLSTPFVSHGSKTIHRTRHYTMSWTRGQLWKCTCGKFQRFQNLSRVQEKILETVREFLDLVKECKILKNFKISRKSCKIVSDTRFLDFAQNRWNPGSDRTKNSRKSSNFEGPKQGKTSCFCLVSDPAKIGKKRRFCPNFACFRPTGKTSKIGEKRSKYNYNRVSVTHYGKSCKKM